MLSTLAGYGLTRSGDSAVSTMKGYRLKNLGTMVRIPPRPGLNFQGSRPVLQPHQHHIQRVSAALTETVKRPGSKFDHSLLAKIKSKIEWNCNAIPPCAYIAHAGRT